MELEKLIEARKVNSKIHPERVQSVSSKELQR
jgi:hypothetical protein